MLKTASYQFKNNESKNDDSKNIDAKKKTPGRRAFLAHSAGIIAALGLPEFAFSAQSTSVQLLNENMSLISGMGGNVLAFSTGDGLMLVDSGAMQYTDALWDELARLAGGQNVHTLINTHWHQDQVGGNAFFGAQGTKIIAHQKTKLHLQTDYYLFAEDRYQQAMPTDAHITEAFYKNGTLAAGNESVEYAYLEMAHTDGDIYIRFPKANVIAVGDVVSPLIDPVFDWFSGGWVGGRVDALNKILSLCDGDTKIVPSYGPVISKAHVEAERDLMQFFYDTLVDQVRMGYTAQDSLASGIMDSLPRKFDDPYQFLYDAHKGVWGNHNKLEPNIV